MLEAAYMQEDSKLNGFLSNFYRRIVISLFTVNWDTCQQGDSDDFITRRGIILLKHIII